MHSLKEIKNVLIIGAGTMGLRISLQCAMSGYEVRLYDTNADQLEKALVIQDKILQSFARKRRIDSTDIPLIKSRIGIHTDQASAAANVHLVNESIIEDKALKIKMYESFAPHIPSTAIITTNTSYLLPSMFAEASGHPENFCAFHFHDVFVARVVDVMPHPSTAEWVTTLLMEFGKTLNQIPVLIKKENSGYLYNTILLAFLNQAAHLLVEGKASIEDIDRSWMGNMNTAIGPFGMLDQIGFPTALKIIRDQKNPSSEAFCILLENYIKENKLGIKTGAGFYDYPNPSYREPDFLN